MPEDEWGVREASARELLIGLRADVSTLREKSEQSERRLQQEFERLRSEVSDNRSEFRRDVKERIDELYRRITKIDEDLSPRFDKKADAKDLATISKNLNMVAMFIIITVIGSVLALVTVSRISTPQFEHVSGGAK